MKTISGVILLAVVFVAVTSFAAADMLKLNNGQVHKGTITAEEDDRIQIKLENSGVRLWFPRDQVLSFEKTEREEDKEAEENSKSDASKLGLDDDAERARQMLEKLRQEQLKNPKRTKKKNRPTSTKPSKTSTQKQAATLAGTQVDAQINILRTNKDIYKRFDAIKKLGKGRAEAAIPDLIHVLDDDVPMLRKEANKSLIAITGQDFKYKATSKRNVRLEAIERWEKWHKGIKNEKARDGLRSWF